MSVAGHGAASLMLAAGVDLKVVQEILGHSMLSLTADTYTSVYPEVVASAAEAAAILVPRKSVTGTGVVTPLSQPPSSHKRIKRTRRSSGGAGGVRTHDLTDLQYPDRRSSPEVGRAGQSWFPWSGAITQTQPRSGLSVGINVGVIMNAQDHNAHPSRFTPGVLTEPYDPDQLKLHVAMPTTGRR